MRLRKIATMLPIVLVGISLLNFRICPATAKTIVVPDDYPTIQQAVNAAANGDTILVRSGVYIENIIISGKSISLIGEDATTTIIRNKDYKQG